jgi:mono/diheme cytochrome c family protein
MKRCLVASGLVVALLAGPANAQRPSARAAQVEQGKEVYTYWCAPCHGPGLGMPGFDALPGAQQLGIKYRGTNIPALLDERTDLVPAFVKTTVRQGVSFMPQFRKTEISDADLDAIAAYLTRNNPKRRP